LFSIIYCFATKVAQDITQLPDDNDEVTPPFFSSAMMMVPSNKLFLISATDHRYWL